MHFSGTMARDANLSEGNPKSLSLGQLGLCEMFRKDFLLFHLRGQSDDSYKKGGMGAQPCIGGWGGHTALEEDAYSLRLNGVMKL